VSFATVTVFVASQRVFIVVSAYFVIDSVRKLLDTPSYVFTFRSAWTWERQKPSNSITVAFVWMLFIDWIKWR
jgi:hypothetical protein